MLVSELNVCGESHENEPFPNTVFEVLKKYFTSILLIVITCIKNNNSLHLYTLVYTYFIHVICFYVM